MIFIKRPEAPKIKIYERTTILDNRKQSDLSESDLVYLKSLEVGHSTLLECLGQPNAKFSRADWETLRAIAFYSNADNYEINGRIKKDSKLPKFTLYKDKDADEEIESEHRLKTHLKRLFNGKCAYCDSNFLATSNADIEHFRPKKGVNRFENNKDSKISYPGYYWLGINWENLYWSCANCNRSNYFLIANKNKKDKVGKHNRFPIYGGEANRRLGHHLNLIEEDDYCLLINPTKENPDDFFTYNELGEVNTKEKKGIRYEKAFTSIIGYGLMRDSLVEERGEVLLELKELLEDVDEVIISYLAKVENSLDVVKESKKMRRKLSSLRRQFRSDKPFLAAKYILFKSFSFSNWEGENTINRMDLLKTSNW